MTINPKLPEGVNFILKKLEEAGFAAYAVGGCVRDILRGVTPNDYDVTTSALPDDVISLFGENAIQVSVNAQEGSNVFCLQNANGTSLPFDLLPSPTGQNTLQSGDVLARFTANSTVEVWIRIDRSQISQTGTYEGVLTFRYSVVEINNEEEQR